MSSKKINRTEKPDSQENPAEIIPDETFQKVAKGMLKTLRINRNTWIVTKPENCNEQYRKEYLDKMGKISFNS